MPVKVVGKNVVSRHTGKVESVKSSKKAAQASARKINKSYRSKPKRGR